MVRLLHCSSSQTAAALRTRLPSTSFLPLSNTSTKPFQQLPLLQSPNSSTEPLADSPLHAVCYSLGIYLLNLFLAFLQPKFDPSLTQDEGLEDGDSQRSPLPTTRDEEFRPFIRRLPEFKFWYSATRAVFIGFCCTWFEVFNVPVFWPVLVVYWIILFTLTSKWSFHFSPDISCLWGEERGAGRR